MRVVAVLLAALAVAASAWWMGKPDPNGPEPRVTHGRWRIENHTLVISADAVRQLGV